jgi:hypothetical protein
MAFKMKYKNSSFPFKSEEKSKKKKDKRTKRQKAIDRAIDEGYVPVPNTKKKLQQFKEAYFEEKFV